MKNKIVSFLAVLTFYSFTVSAQVQVRKEPRHNNVLENKYVRLLDVKIQPGDTSLFHIHSTPSVFLLFTTTVVCSQIKGKEWVTAKNAQGNASFRSFVNDTLVHRVSNCDTVPFHVTDAELLSPYKPANRLQPLPFTQLFENEKVSAYRLTAAVFNNQIISGRGPMIAQLVAGSDVKLHNKKGKELSQLKAGKYLYIKPGTAFYFSATGDEKLNMVLFEIK
jgi:quercetin dioxygenase-like cupin family protein